MICSKVDDYNFWTAFHDENLEGGKISDTLRYKQVEFDERNRIMQNQHKIDQFLSEEIGQSEGDHYDLSFIKHKIFASSTNAAVFSSTSHNVSGMGSQNNSMISNNSRWDENEMDFNLANFTR